MEIPGERFRRIIYGAFALLGLCVIYIFQYTDFLYILFGNHFSPEYHFITNRMVRIFINDSCMLMLIYVLFMDKKVVKLAIYIQVIDLLVLFPLYLLLKLPREGVSELSSPFLAQLHRLIVNPTLMILLIGGIYYQRLGMKSVT